MDLVTSSGWGPAIAGAAGLGWGYIADRIGARWPVHHDREVRGRDWRTVCVVVLAGAGFALLGSRIHSPQLFGLLGVYLGALTVLLATDLDQRLLPDLITLPLVALALAVGILDLNPLVRGEWPQAVVAAVGTPIVLFLLSIPFGAGAIGIGDLKLMVSVGLIAGWERTVLAVIAAALLSGVVVAVLLVARRVTMRSFIPFGPFLIIGSVLGLLAGRP